MIQERRTVTAELELRADPGKTMPTVVGYAAVFNSLSQNLGGFVEQVAPGAFRKTITEQDVRALFNHDPNFVLGRNRSETLRMGEDTYGLHYEVDLPNTQAGRDVAEMIERRDVSGSSFGFRTIEDEWGTTEQDFPLRTLRSVQLFDVSPVTYPAYLGTESALRSLASRLEISAEHVLEAAATGELRAIILGTDSSSAAPAEPEAPGDTHASELSAARRAALVTLDVTGHETHERLLRGR